jgi:hypothetical protein
MDLLNFLKALAERDAPCRLDRVRDAVTVIVATPGARWEVEFMDGGQLEAERFVSDGTIADEGVLATLLADLEYRGASECATA